MQNKFARIEFRSAVIADFKAGKIKSIDDVPITNKTAYDALVQQLPVHEFINVVKLGENFPAKPDPWTTLILTEEWGLSYAKAVNSTPKPLYIAGHTDSTIHPKARAIPDGYITAAAVIDGDLYLRNTLVETEGKKELIQQTLKEIKAGMLSTSTGDYMEYTIVEDDEHPFESVYYAVQSMKGQSNAIVEFDLTGSSAEILFSTFKNEDGGVATSNSNNQGDRHMNPSNAEMITALKNQLDSGRLALAEVAKSLGIEPITMKQQEALKRLGEVETKVGDVAEYVNKMETAAQATFTSLKEAKLKEKFNNAELLEIAEPLFMLKSGSASDIEKEVERISELKVFKTIQGKIAGSINTAFTGSNGESESDDSAGTMEA